MKDQKARKEIIRDVHGYLSYLKEIGITDIPASPTSSEPGSRVSVRTLEDIRKDFGACRKCRLHQTRHSLVFGEGSEKAKLMIIGEGPGHDEDVQGRPFVGRAGQLLTKILQSIQLAREEVYITNIVKCRPPQNRNPLPDEIEACHPCLVAQIAAIRPKIICALGTFSAQTLLKTDVKISVLRGRFYDVGGTKVLPTYHPAFLLRNPERKRDVWEDMKQILKELSTEGG